MFYKDIARSYFGAVNNCEIPLVNRLVREDYIQHNPYLKTGRNPFTAVLPILKKHQSKIINRLILQDGSFIIMHHQWENAIPFGAQDIQAFHIIRFDENNKIAEHWSAMMEIPSGTNPMAGETEIGDFEREIEYRSLISRLHNELNTGEIASIDKFYEDSFTCHQPLLGSDLRSVKSSLRCDFEYLKQHRIFAEGNFVLSISEGYFKSKHSAIYDLYCLKNGLISEQWTVLQDIPKENLANSNGMFGF